jgi:hypothetical protein
MSKQVGATQVKEARCYLWVPLYKASCTCHGCNSFQAHSCLCSFFLFYLLLLFSFLFSAQEIIRGHCPGVVASGDSVTHKYFHRNEKVDS